MKHSTLFLLFVIFFVACKDKKNAFQPNLNAVKSFVSAFDTDSYDNYNSISFLEQYIDPSIKEEITLVYILNATCSSCIVEFLNFYDIFYKSNLRIPIYCFLQETFKVNLEYYLEKIDIEYNEGMCIIEIGNEYFLNEKTIHFGDVFFSYNYKNIAKLFLYDSTIKIQKM